jgi:Caspase domain
MQFIIRLLARACLAIAAFSADPASAEKRVALVIGNADYKIGPLANPVNDATAVGEAFEKALRFDKVILRKNSLSTASARRSWNSRGR